MNQKSKSILQWIITIVVGGAFLIIVFKNTDWHELFVKFQNADYKWIAWGLVITLFSHILRAYRALLLYDPLGYKISFKNSFYAVIIGYMMNYIIPRAGEISRCATLVKTNEMPMSKSFGTVVLERILDMLILIILLIIIFIMKFDLISTYVKNQLSSNTIAEQNGFPVKYIILIIFLVLAVSIYLLRNKISGSQLFIKVKSLFIGFKEGLFSIRKVKNIWWFFLLSVSIWFSYLLVMYLSLFSMEATSHITFVDCLSVFAIGAIGVVLPAPAAGAGTYHFAVMQSLLLFGVPLEDGKAYATIVHGVQMILVLVLGLICYLIVMMQQKKSSA